MADESVTLQFPAGPAVVRTRPTKAQLQANANQWLTLMRTQMGSVEYWAAQGDRVLETLATLKVLASQLEHARRALAEAELAK